MDRCNFYFIFFGGSGLPLILIVLVLTGTVTIPGAVLAILATAAAAALAVGGIRTISRVLSSGRITPRRLARWELDYLQDDLDFDYEDVYGRYEAPQRGVLIEGRDLMLPEDRRHFDRDFL